MVQEGRHIIGVQMFSLITSVFSGKHEVRLLAENVKGERYWKFKGEGKGIKDSPKKVKE